MEKWRNESQGCLTFRQTLFLDPFASGCDWGATSPSFLGKPWD